MSDGFRISLDGLSLAIDEVQAPLNNLRPMLSNVGDYFADETIKRFEQTNVAPDGKKWKQSERSKRDGGKTLVDTEQLKDSIHKEVHSDTVEIGTNVHYAAIHQFGGTTRPHKISAKAGGVLAFNGHFAKSVNHPGSVIPARPFLGIAVGDEQEVERIVLRHWGLE